MAKSWLEVTLETDGEAAEAVADLFQRYGYQGVAIEQQHIPDITPWEDEAPPPDAVIVRAYLPENDQTRDLQRQLEAGLYHLSRLYPVPQQPAYRRIHEEDWAEAWKANYHPLRIGQHFYICPAWVDPTPQPGDHVLTLDPGMAFGTGSHPSTQLCLMALEGLVPLPPHVLDLGSGSGILAIGAAKLGAAHTWALDIDEVAVEAAQSNIDLNSVSDRVTVQQGSLETLLTSPRRFGLLLVNILAKTIIRMCQEGLANLVQPGGVAVFGGIIEEQGAEVEAALRACGLEPYHRRTIGEWIVIEARRSAD